MKRFLLSLLIVSSFSVFAQVEISPYAGYFFGGKSDFYEGSLKINDNMNYGAHLSFNMGGGVGAELSYSLSASSAKWNPSFQYIDRFPAQEFDINTHVFLLGGYKEIELANERVLGFMNLKGGAILYSPQNSNIQDVWRFLIGIGGGVKIFFNDVVGIRLQGNMYLPMYFNGGGIYCGIGTGGSNCGASVGGTVVIFEGDLTAGLIFKLGY